MIEASEGVLLDVRIVHKDERVKRFRCRQVRVLDTGYHLRGVQPVGDMPVEFELHFPFRRVEAVIWSLAVDESEAGSA